MRVDFLCMGFSTLPCEQVFDAELRIIGHREGIVLGHGDSLLSIPAEQWGVSWLPLIITDLLIIERWDSFGVERRWVELDIYYDGLLAAFRGLLCFWLLIVLPSLTTDDLESQLFIAGYPLISWCHGHVLMMLVFLIPVHLMVIILYIDTAKDLCRIAIFLNWQV